MTGQRMAQRSLLTVGRLSALPKIKFPTACRVARIRDRSHSFHSTSLRGMQASPVHLSSPIQKKTLETLKITNLEAPHTGFVKIISLNRPSARNAISRQLLQEFSTEIESIHAEGAGGSTRVVILASEVDECFCAGADLKERKGMSVEETAEFLKKLRHTFTRVHTLPVPSIASVSGMALGGGLELALCTHLRVFSANALVGLPETRLAIIPGAGGTHRLPAVIGLTRAMEIIFTGKRIGPTQALDWGLCNYVARAADGESADKTRAREAALKLSIELAMEIADGGPIALRAAVQAMRGGGRQEQENEAYEMVLASKDRTEALKAFGEKRKPIFKGE